MELKLNEMTPILNTKKVGPQQHQAYSRGCQGLDQEVFKQRSPRCLPEYYSE